MVRPGTKAVYGMLGMVALIGLCVFLADWFIDQLPIWDRPSAWRWFFVGWIAAAIASGLIILPSWLNGSIAGRETEDEKHAFTRQMAIAGGCIGLFSASTSFIGPSVGVGLMALGAGGLVALLIMGIALNTTRKGRAMLDEAKRSGHAV